MTRPSAVGVLLAWTVAVVVSSASSGARAGVPQSDDATNTSDAGASQQDAARPDAQQGVGIDRKVSDIVPPAPQGIAIDQKVSDKVPPALQGIGIDQRLGAKVPLDLEFRDETGRAVRLQDYFADKPVILTLNYYQCPMLCTLVLNGLVSSLRTLNFSAGNEFTIVTVSINPRETPALAASKKASYLHDYGRPGAGAGWHFLTGDEAPIARLAEAAGFHYRYDPVSHQYAHAAGIMILTRDGRLARYFYGVEFAPRDLRLGLIEASEGKIGTLADQLLLFCFHYDPATGKYGTVALDFMRAAGVLTIVGLGLLIFMMLRRDARRTAARGHA